MEKNSAENRINVLIEAFPYIRKLKGNLLIIKFGGSLIDNKKTMEDILYDISFLHFLGMKPIIIHGGGKDITRELTRNNIKTNIVHGFRYTCAKSIKLIIDVLDNKINKELAFILKNFSISPCSLSGLELLLAKRKELDLGFVGDICEVQDQKILKILSNGQLPIISPLARDINSDVVYNINADEVASAVAMALKSRRIIFITDVPGILSRETDKKSLIASIKVKELSHLLSQGNIKGGMLPKIKAAIQCLNSGIKKVHFIDGNRSHSLLLEILSDAGVGTEISL